MLKQVRDAKYDKNQANIERKVEHEQMLGEVHFPLRQGSDEKLNERSQHE